MNWISAHIEMIPSSFWGVVIGSLFSLGGVLVANQGSLRRLERQLNHDREEKSNERKQSLRKEIYLAASEAVWEGLISILRFANLDLPNDNITKSYIDKASSFAKVYVIANENTARAVSTLTGEIGATHLRLFASRYLLLEEKQSIQQINDQIISFEKDRDKVVEMMRQYNIEGIPNHARWSVLQGNFDFDQQRIDELSGEASRRAISLYQRDLLFMKECVEEYNKQIAFMIPTLSNIRKELDLSINEEAFTQIFNEGIEKQEESISQFMAVMHERTLRHWVSPLDMLRSRLHNQSLQNAGHPSCRSPYFRGRIFQIAFEIGYSTTR